jgi:hypothetical protein
MDSSSAEQVRNTVREHYGKVAETNGAVGCASASRFTPGPWRRNTTSG